MSGHRRHRKAPSRSGLRAAGLALAGIGWGLGAGVEAESQPENPCSAASFADAGEGQPRRVRLEVDGLERFFWVQVPKAVEPSGALPLILDFHGYTGTALEQAEDTEIGQIGTQRGFAVIFGHATSFQAPNGQRISSWNDLAGNASPGPKGPTCTEEAAFTYASPPECGEPTPCNWATCHDDLAYVDAVLEWAEATLCIDPQRIYATGSSNGGMFVHRLACDRGQRFAAVAPVMGTPPRGFVCAPAEPVALMNVYGTRDDYVDQVREVSSDGYRYTSAAEVLEAWAVAQQCQGTLRSYPVEAEGVRELQCVERPGCATGTEVVHCTFDGAHEWPRVRSNDPAKAHNFGTETILDFFEKHSKR